MSHVCFLQHSRVYFHFVFPFFPSRKKFTSDHFHPRIAVNILANYPIIRLNWRCNTFPTASLKTFVKHSFRDFKWTWWEKKKKRKKNSLSFPTMTTDCMQIESSNRFCRIDRMENLVLLDDCHCRS